MYRLITIGGHGGLAEGRKGAFYNTLEEFHKYWESIDVISTKPSISKPVLNYFGNVFLNYSSLPKLFQPLFIRNQLKKIVKEKGADLIVVQEYPPFYNSLGLFLSFSFIKKIPVSYEILHIVGYPKAGGLKE